MFLFRVHDATNQSTPGVLRPASDWYPPLIEPLCVVTSDPEPRPDKVLATNACGLVAGGDGVAGDDGAGARSAGLLGCAVQHL